MIKSILWKKDLIIALKYDVNINNNTIQILHYMSQSGCNWYCRVNVVSIPDQF